MGTAEHNAASALRVQLGKRANIKLYQPGPPGTELPNSGVPRRTLAPIAFAAHVTRQQPEVEAGAGCWRRATCPRNSRRLNPGQANCMCTRSPEGRRRSTCRLGSGQLARLGFCRKTLTELGSPETPGSHSRTPIDTPFNGTTHTFPQVNQSLAAVCSTSPAHDVMHLTTSAGVVND